MKILIEVDSKQDVTDGDADFVLCMDKIWNLYLDYLNKQLSNTNTSDSQEITRVISNAFTELYNQYQLFRSASEHFETILQQRNKQRYDYYKNLGVTKITERV